ncbi:MAG: peroxidase family protein, partial [Bacteroidota bacterium]
FDAKLIDDVRNFLFGPPGAGGLDLASININRGRERGLPDYNSIRRSLGLRSYSIFREINLEDIGVTYDLLSNYLNIGKVDPWVGMLAERRLPGALFGETVMEVLTRQFTALRDGDRFFYLNDPILAEEEKEIISNTTFHDIIMRNTTITLMQDDVFDAIPHEEICGNMTIDVLGKIRLENGRPVAQVGVDLEAGNTFLTLSTNGAGDFDFRSVPACDAKQISLNKEDAHDNGVSTLDLIIVQKHILNRDPLDSPYKVLAADVDNSGSVSTLDLIKMRKVILSIDLYFNEEGAWEFLPADLEFTDESNPFIDALPNIYDIYDFGSDFTQDFVAIKLGDVNNSAETGAETQANILESRSANGLSLLLTDQDLLAGEEYTIQVQAQEARAISGFQFGLRYQTNAVDLVDLEQLALPNLNRENFALMNDQGLMAISWNSVEDGLDIQSDQELFSFRIRPLKNGRLSDFLYLDNRGIRAEAYNNELETKAVQLQFQQDDQVLPAVFQVYQNQPNPFKLETSIPFYLPADGEIELSIFDVSGKTIFQESRAFNKGSNQWTVQRNDIAGVSGIYYYKISSNNLTFTKKLIISE